jgi:hypothetical protein
MVIMRAQRPCLIYSGPFHPITREHFQNVSHMSYVILYFFLYNQTSMQKYKHRVNDFTFRKDFKFDRRQLLYLKFLHVLIRTSVFTYMNKYIHTHTHKHTHIQRGTLQISMLQWANAKMNTDAGMNVEKYCHLMLVVCVCDVSGLPALIRVTVIITINVCKVQV